MNLFESIKNKNKEELARFLLEVSSSSEPWFEWFNKNYCKKCENVRVYIAEFGKEVKCAPCQVFGECPLGVGISEVTEKEIIEMWLDQEC